MNKILVVRSGSGKHKILCQLTTLITTFVIRNLHLRFYLYLCTHIYY